MHIRMAGQEKSVNVKLLLFYVNAALDFWSYANVQVYRCGEKKQRINSSRKHHNSIHDFVYPHDILSTVYIVCHRIHVFTYIEILKTHTIPTPHHTV